MIHWKGLFPFILMKAWPTDGRTDGWTDPVTEIRQCVLKNGKPLSSVELRKSNYILELFLALLTVSNIQYCSCLHCAIFSLWNVFMILCEMNSFPNAMPLGWLSSQSWRFLSELSYCVEGVLNKQEILLYLILRHDPDSQARSSNTKYYSTWSSDLIFRHRRAVRTLQSHFPFPLTSASVRVWGGGCIAKK